MSYFPYIEKGNKNGPVIVLLGGFPDNQLSSWGKVIPAELEKLGYHLIFMCLPGYDNDKSYLKPWGYNTNEILLMMHNTMKKLGIRYV